MPPDRRGPRPCLHTETPLKHFLHTSVFPSLFSPCDAQRATMRTDSGRVKARRMKADESCRMVFVTQIWTSTHYPSSPKSWFVGAGRWLVLSNLDLSCLSTTLDYVSRTTLEYTGSRESRSSANVDERKSGSACQLQANRPDEQAATHQLSKRNGACKAGGFTSTAMLRRRVS